jgi:hypothetical protein
MRRLRGQVVALAPRHDHTGLVVERQHRPRGLALRVAVDVETWKAMLRDRAPDEILGAWVTMERDTEHRWTTVTFDDGMVFPLTVSPTARRP